MCVYVSDLLSLFCCYTGVFCCSPFFSLVRIFQLHFLVFPLLGTHIHLELLFLYFSCHEMLSLLPNILKSFFLEVPRSVFNYIQFPFKSKIPAMHSQFPATTNILLTKHSDKLFLLASVKFKKKEFFYAFFYPL